MWIRPHPGLRVVLGLFVAMAAAGCGGENSAPVSRAAPAVRGPLAPDVSLVDMGGKSLNLSDYAGRPVIINFWATWCQPCRREIPSLIVLHDRFSRRGLEIIALSIDTDEHTVAEFLTATPLPFRVALDLDQSVARRYGVSTVPATFFLDRKGHVVERVDGAVDWTREDVLASVEQLVGESS